MFGGLGRCFRVAAFGLDGPDGVAGEPEADLTGLPAVGPLRVADEGGGEVPGSGGGVAGGHEVAGLHDGGVAAAEVGFVASGGWGFADV